MDVVHMDLVKQEDQMQRVVLLNVKKQDLDVVLTKKHQQEVQMVKVVTETVPDMNLVAVLIK